MSAFVLWPLLLGCAVPDTPESPSPTAPPSDTLPTPPPDTVPSPPSSAVAECDSPDPAWVWCDDFEQDREADYFEYDAELADDVGVQGSAGIRAVYQPGESYAGSMKVAFGSTPDAYMAPVDDGTAKYREIHWRVLLKNPESWVGGGGDKLSRAMVFASSSWAQAMAAHVWSGSGSGGEAPDHLLIDPASGTDEAGNLRAQEYNDFANFRWLGSATSTTPIFASGNLGAWRCIEARVRLNDAGQANGLFELRIDGALEAERGGLNWVGAYDEYGINAIFLEHFWNDSSPVLQERYLDNFVVSTEPIGCPTVAGAP